MPRQWEQDLGDKMECIQCGSKQKTGAKFCLNGVGTKTAPRTEFVLVERSVASQKYYYEFK